MPRSIVLYDSEGNVGLNEAPKMLSNTAGPMPFDGSANIGGWLKEKDRVEDFMSEFSSDSRDDWGINEEFLLPNY